MSGFSSAWYRGDTGLRDPDFDPEAEAEALRACTGSVSVTCRVERVERDGTITVLAVATSEAPRAVDPESAAIVRSCFPELDSPPHPDDRLF